MSIRKAHVKRVYGKDPDTGEQNDDLWVDVLRIDQMRANYQTTPQGYLGMETIFSFVWRDEENEDEESPNTARKTRLREIRDPRSPNDDTVLIKLRIVERLTMRENGLANGVTGQAVVWTFNNNDANDQGEPSRTRRFHTVKVTNNDLGGTDLADSEDRMDWAAYLDLLRDGEEDEEQYLNVEFVDRFQVNRQSDGTQGILGQAIYVSLRNKTIEELFDAGDDGGEVPPVKTDPLQLIVNVSLGGLAVEFKDGAA